MTAPSPTAAPPTDEDLLIHEARRQRRLRRSGRSLAGMLALAAFFGAIGYTLVFHPGVISANVPFSGAFLQLVVVADGGVACLIAVLFMLGAAFGARPAVPWGDPVPGDCPECGKPALRSDDAVVREAGGLAITARGTVTLCRTPGCEHATAAVITAGELSPRRAGRAWVAWKGDGWGGYGGWPAGHLVEGG